eukprot:6839470-Prorocentrum_lima.AAC.1
MEPRSFPDCMPGSGEGSASGRSTGTRCRPPSCTTSVYSSSGPSYGKGRVSLPAVPSNRKLRKGRPRLMATK